MATFSNKLKDLFSPYIHPSIRESIYHINLQATKIFALFMSILESAIFLFMIFFEKEIFGEPFVLLMCLYAIFSSLFFLFITNYALRKSHKPYSRYRFIYIAYYFSILAFGMFTSFYHYSHGKQMLAFFATEFCVASFLILPPWCSILLIVGSYIGFYGILFAYNGAPTVNLINYTVLAFLTTAGSVRKYRTQATELERIHRIETMNEMMQNLPVHDATTNLKSRYALRDDFTSYQNHPIIVIMLDIDDFNSINEAYGTKTGNEVLSNIGELISNHLTENAAYRYGDDSFLIILQDVDVDVAMQKLSRFERSLATLKVPGSETIVHCNSGYSHGTPRDEEDLRLLIDAAAVKRREFL
ncbi:diguanylate cyclase domain-containing protein [Butyrivibrio sp. MB2005]|uniref:diguanylate cyclase domain-containing protein n=1 Tax=Butyrivibrio sp. MB2005 TaxID=1280678 RepID=UPI000408EF74|nr:diguanylate cyclase [Butyrivibrio sp. MB2005]